MAGDLFFWTLEEKKASEESNPDATSEVIPQALISFKDKRAILALVAMDKDPGDPIYETSEFFIQSLNILDRERLQVVQGFDSMHLQSFGRAPISITVAGTLLNAENAQWHSKFMINYDKYFRATRAIENNARCVLTVDNKIIEGQILASTVQQDSQNPRSVLFNMSLVVYKITYVGQGTVFGENTPFHETGTASSSGGGGLTDEGSSSQSESEMDEAKEAAMGGDAGLSPVGTSEQPEQA